jgi:acyl carrier protein
MTLNELIAQELRDKPANITDATGRENHRRWDSFAQVQLVVALEDAYKVKFSNAEIEAMTSVASIRDALKAKGVDA